MKLLIALTLVLGITGCASYVDGIHKQIDREEARSDPRHQSSDPYASYRDQGFKRAR